LSKPNVIPYQHLVSAFQQLTELRNSSAWTDHKRAGFFSLSGMSLRSLWRSVQKDAVQSAWAHRNTQKCKALFREKSTDVQPTEHFKDDRNKINQEKQS